MNWQRSGEVGQVSEPYSISKVFDDGCTLYLLKCDDVVISYHNDFEEAQEAAENHQAAQQVVEGRT